MHAQETNQSLKIPRAALAVRDAHLWASYAALKGLGKITHDRIFRFTLNTRGLEFFAFDNESGRLRLTAPDSMPFFPLTPWRKALLSRQGKTFALVCSGVKMFGQNVNPWCIDFPAHPQLCEVISKETELIIGLHNLANDTIIYKNNGPTIPVET